SLLASAARGHGPGAAAGEPRVFARPRPRRLRGQLGGHALLQPRGRRPVLSPRCGCRRGRHDRAAGEHHLRVLSRAAPAVRRSTGAPAVAWSRGEPAPAPRVARLRASGRALLALRAPEPLLRHDQRPGSRTHSADVRHLLPTHSCIRPYDRLRPRWGPSPRISPNLPRASRAPRSGRVGRATVSAASSPSRVARCRAELRLALSVALVGGTLLGAREGLLTLNANSF